MIRWAKQRAETNFLVCIHKMRHKGKTAKQAIRLSTDLCTEIQNTECLFITPVNCCNISNLTYAGILVDTSFHLLYH